MPIWLIILLTLVASYASATLYRLGGASKKDAAKEYPWAPEWFRNLPKKRDVGCGVVTGLTTWMILDHLGVGSPWWIYLITGGILWGALSTYHDTMPYNWMNPDDNFWLHGFFCGLAYIFFGIHTGLWMQLGIRIAVIAVFMGVWSHILFSDAWVEENGRGGILPLSLLLLLI